MYKVLKKSFYLIQSYIKSVNRLMTKKFKETPYPYIQKLYVRFTTVPLTPLSDSQQYPWHYYLIHNSTLDTIIWFTTVPLTLLSDSQQYPWHHYLIHNSTLDTIIWFTTVPLTSLSDSQQYPWHYYLIHNSTLDIIIWLPLLNWDNFFLIIF